MNRVFLQNDNFHDLTMYNNIGIIVEAFNNNNWSQLYVRFS